MGKMYYSEDEATQKLRAVGKDLAALVSAGELRAYPDGAKSMFKAEDIDQLAPYTSGGDAEEIELAPAADEPDAGDAVALSEADVAVEETKDDTVITSEGISIFDDEDLEIDSGDPMAKTAIAPGVEDEISLEGVGSGSGLLDLTRESDDTSLGEVLEHIDVEAAVPSGAPPMVDEIPDEPPAVDAAYEPPAVVEALDASAGAFAGLIAGTCLVMLLGCVAAASVLLNNVPSYVHSVQGNLLAWLGGAVVVSVVLAVVGYMIAKAGADRAAALQRGG